MEIHVIDEIRSTFDMRKGFMLTNGRFACDPEEPEGDKMRKNGILFRQYDPDRPRSLTKERLAIPESVYEDDHIYKAYTYADDNGSRSVNNFLQGDRFD